MFCIKFIILVYTLYYRCEYPIDYGEYLYIIKCFSNLKNVFVYFTEDVADEVENKREASPPSSLPPTPPNYYDNKNGQIQNINIRNTTNILGKLDLIPIYSWSHFFCI